MLVFAIGLGWMLVAIPLTSAGALFVFALYRELTKR
jgi:hypothetical protein